MISVLARIILRYGAGALVAHGFLSDDGLLSSDPDVLRLVEAGIGLGLSGATEAWYYIARKLGCAT